MKGKKRLFKRIGAFVLTALTVLTTVFGSANIEAKAAGIGIYQVKWIAYSRIGGSGQTGLYTANGRYIYCIESNKDGWKEGQNFPGFNSDPSMAAVSNGSNSWPILASAIAHGPGGDLYNCGRQWWINQGRSDIANDEELMYLVTHIAANYGYMGASSNDPNTIYKGCPQSFITNYLEPYIVYLYQISQGARDLNNTRYSNMYVYVYRNDDGRFQNMGLYAGVSPINEGPSDVTIEIPVTKTGASLTDTATVDGAKYGLYNSSDSLLTEITLTGTKTSATGTFSYKFTQSGTYYIRETHEPTGYLKDDTKYPFTVDISNQEVNVSDNHFVKTSAKAASLSVTEIPKYMPIKVSLKKGGEKGFKNAPSLDGAIYGLFKSDGTQVKAIILTGDDKEATGVFDEELEKGDYYIQEIDAPAGYEKDDTKYPFSVDPETSAIAAPGATNGNFEQVDTTNVVLSVVENLAGFPLKIFVEKNGENDDPEATLDGAQYEVWDTNGNLFGTITCTVDPNNWKVATGTLPQRNFPEGDYYIKESVTPDGYKLDTNEYAFSVDDTGAVTTMDTHYTVNATDVLLSVNEEIDREPLKLSFYLTKTGNSNVDSSTVAGAIYGIFKADGTELSRVAVTGTKTLATGVLSYTFTETGEYYVKEITAPAGYEKDETEYPFTLTFVGKRLIPITRQGAGTMTLRADNVSADIEIVETPNSMRVDVEIIKDGDSNVDDATVVGAIYGLYDSNDTELERVTLAGTKNRASGTFSYVIQASGNYYIAEIQEPNGFKKDDTHFPFTVNVATQKVTSGDTHFTIAAEKITANVTDIPKSYKVGIDIYKTGTSTGDYQSLGGAIYGVFDSNDKEIARRTLIATATGAEAHFDKIIEETGDYYIKEIKAPDGFRENDEKYPFTVNVEGQKLTTSASSVEVINNTLAIHPIDEAKEAKFHFIKKGEDGAVLANAKFEVYLRSDLTKDANGKYVFTGATVMDTIVTDATGYGESKTLNLGVYVLREVEVAPEYYLIEPKEVSLQTDNQDLDLGTIIDKFVEIYVRASKKDAGTTKIVLKAGTSYKIYDVTNSKYLDNAGSDTFTCDASGVIKIPVKLTPGTYRAEEVAAPSGYLKDASAVDFVVDANLPYIVENDEHIYDIDFLDTEKLGEITITKTGKTLSSFTSGAFVWEETPLPGAKYEVRAKKDIYSQDNQGDKLYSKDDLVTTITTGGSGKATATDLHFGEYYLVEVTAPVGYILDDTPIDVTLTDKTPSATKIVETTTQFDEKQNVVLDLYKYDEDTKQPLAGAEFELSANEDIRNFKGDVIVTKGTVLESATSDAKGSIKFTLDLPFNKYVVKEVKAPEGYVLNDTPFEVGATAPSSDKTEISYKYEWANKPVKGEVTFYKVGESFSDFKNGQFVWESTSLKGAEFELYANEVYTYDHAVDADGNRTTYYKKGELIQKVFIDDTGTAKITDMPIGTYYLVETKAPYGMTKLKNPYNFEIKYKDQKTPLVTSTETILNERQKLVLNVYKTGGAGKKLSGGEFTLYADEDIKNYKGDVVIAKDAVIAKVAAKDGVVDFGLDLPHGKYYVKETGQIPKYYKTDETFRFDASYTSQDIELLEIEISIYNKSIPNLGRLVLKMGNKIFEKNTNNYVTGDEDGQTGYSVLVGESKDIKQSRAIATIYVYAGIGAIVFLFIGAVILLYNRRRKVANGERESIFESEEPLDGEDLEEMGDTEEE